MSSPHTSSQARSTGERAHAVEGKPLTGGQRKRRLLVVDDDPGICRVVSQVASDTGFETVSVHTARDIHRLPPESFDLVILDLLMPGVDGIEMLRIPDSVCSTNLVLMSGLDSRTLESARQLAEARGFKVAGLLKKPFRINKLKELLEGLQSTDSVLVSAQSNRRSQPRITLDEIARAIACNELTVHLQPQIALRDFAWSGVEALVRWQHPLHGLLYPDAFVEQAENSELALPFTHAVLRASIEAVKGLEKMTGFSGTLSVNLPPSALTDVLFPEDLIAMLEAQCWDRSRLMLELTETSVPKSQAVALEIETRLRMRGIHTSIDDFGTGYSSLERLHASPFEELKVDLIFVKRADHDAAARAIIRNAVRLGHSLGMKVVAEGVETERTLRWLKALGCDLAQGYWICRPMPAGELTHWAGSWGQKVAYAQQVRPTSGQIAA